MSAVNLCERDFICSGCLNDAGRFVMQRRGHAVVRCRRCELAHLLPRPQISDNVHQLDDLGHYDDVTKNLRRGFAYHSMKLLRMLRSYSPPPGRLLEIGCATGLFLRDAMAAGYSVVGLEPASQHRQLIPPDLASSVLPQKLEDANFQDGTFDAIVAIQLLEHLVNPAVFAEKLKRVLKTGGIAYVETPNFDCVYRRVQLPSWINNNVTAGHWHLFNPRSMAAFCDRMGLRVVGCWTFFKALSVHSRSAMLGKSMAGLDYTLGRVGLGNNVAVLITRD